MLFMLFVMVFHVRHDVTLGGIIHASWVFHMKIHESWDRLNWDVGSMLYLQAQGNKFGEVARQQLKAVCKARGIQVWF